MKTLKKLMVLSITGLAVTACGGNGGSNSGGDTSVDPTIRPGYTSLANKNANGPIDEEGYYTAGGIKFKTKDVLKTTYATEPANDFFNYLTNTWTYNSYHYCNMVDGLVENDKYGNIVGAIAKAFKTTENADGTQTWSFQLREDATWVKNDTGEFVANVTAHDFVSAAEYVLTALNGSGTTSLYTSFVVGAEDYLLGKTDDFATVGVKAVEDYILEYTLLAPTPYFYTVLTYSPYLPVYGEFLESEGTDFGTTVNDILVNGAFRITEHTPESKIVYTKNASYYDKEHVYVNTVERKYVPGTATPDTTRTWFEAGDIDSFSVSKKDATGYAKYVTGADGTGSLKSPADPNCNGIQSYYSANFVGYWNFNRSNYEFSADAHVTTPAERKATNLAIYNKDFRLGFLYGLDVEENLKQRDPNEPYNFVVRGFTTKELASAGGKDYTDIMNDVYNEKQGLSGDDKVSLIGIDNGGDPVHSVEKAREFFAAAKVELDKANVTYPIYVDMIGDQEVEAHAYEVEMVKDLELAATVNGTKMVKINWLIPSSDSQNSDWGSINPNYDYSMWSGWGPDYADPNTFGHCFAIYGDMVEYLNLPTEEADLNSLEVSEYVPQKYQDLITGSGDNKDYSKALEAMQNDILGEYNELYKKANAIIDGAKAYDRFRAFAEAEYFLIYEAGIISPWFSLNGYTASVARTVPWQAGRASYGLTSDKFKNVIAIGNAVSKEQRKAVTDEYEAGK